LYNKNLNNFICSIT